MIPLSYQKYFIFSHPDYTVGFGISPNHALRLAGFTAGREFHPALKIFYSFYLLTISQGDMPVNKNFQRAIDILYFIPAQPHHNGLTVLCVMRHFSTYPAVFRKQKFKIASIFHGKETFHRPHPTLFHLAALDIRN